MQIPDSRFVRIAGDTVSVQVDSADEARHAVKELRLIKRQVQRHKREMAKQAKTAKATARPPGKPAARSKRAGPVIDNPLSYVWHALAAVAGAAGGKPADNPGTASKRGTANERSKSATAVSRSIARADAILTGIDACMLQIEAKLLEDKAPKRKPPASRS